MRRRSIPCRLGGPPAVAAFASHNFSLHGRDAHGTTQTRRSDRASDGHRDSRTRGIWRHDSSHCISESRDATGRSATFEPVLRDVDPACAGTGTTNSLGTCPSRQRSGGRKVAAESISALTENTFMIPSSANCRHSANVALLCIVMLSVILFFRLTLVEPRRCLRSIWRRRRVSTGIVLPRRWCLYVFTM